MQSFICLYMSQLFSACMGDNVFTFGHAESLVHSALLFICLPHSYNHAFLKKVLLVRCCIGNSGK